MWGTKNNPMTSKICPKYSLQDQFFYVLQRFILFCKSKGVLSIVLYYKIFVTTPVNSVCWNECIARSILLHFFCYLRCGCEIGWTISVYVKSEKKYQKCRIEQLVFTNSKKFDHDWGVLLSAGLWVFFVVPWLFFIIYRYSTLF